MKKTNASTRSRYGPCIAAACATLALSATAGEPLTLQLHWFQVPGSREMKSGNYERAVERLEARIARGNSSPSRRTAVLIDLCVGNIMLNRLEEATRVCDEATKTGWYADITYNNRGVLNMVRGRHEAAVRDFGAAVRSNGPDRIARRNQRVAEERVAAIAWQRQQTVLAGNVDVRDVSTISLRIEKP